MKERATTLNLRDGRAAIDGCIEAEALWRLDFVGLRRQWVRERGRENGWMFGWMSTECKLELAGCGTRNEDGKVLWTLDDDVSLHSAPFLSSSFVVSSRGGWHTRSFNSNYECDVMTNRTWGNRYRAALLRVTKQSLENSPSLEDKSCPVPTLYTC